MRGPYHHPHHGETREIRLSRHHADRQSASALSRLAPHHRNTIINLALGQTERPKIEPTDLDIARNQLRPASLKEMIGQEMLKPLLRRLIDSAKASGRPLDHMLLVGASGTGKSTTAMAVARELGTRIFMMKAPIDMPTLEALCECTRNGDVIFVDEIHLMVHGDRRGITQAADPESFYHVLEDGILLTKHGPQIFPHVTWIGATTDVGLLPEPLVNRFALQPRLASYTEYEMAEIARRNAEAFELKLDPGVDVLFAGASRLNPRQVNSFMRAARALADGQVSARLAQEVITELFGFTLDGLDPSMQTVLRFLYLNCRRETRLGVSYSASVNTLATAAGHGRDTKAIALRTEPWLLQQGYLTVQSTGRTLTEKGIQRARELCQ